MDEAACPRFLNVTGGALVIYPLHASLKVDSRELSGGRGNVEQTIGGSGQVACNGVGPSLCVILAVDCIRGATAGSVGRDENPIAHNGNVVDDAVTRAQCAVGQLGRPK